MRVFRLSRITGRVRSRSGRFTAEVPDHVDVRATVAAWAGEVATATARICLRRDSGYPLRAKAVDVHNAIRTVDGVIEPKVESQVLVPKLNLIFDPYKVKEYGVKPRDVVDAIDALNNGRPVSEVHQGEKKFEIHVRGHEDVRRTLGDLRRLEIDLPGGGTVRPSM